MRRLLLVGFVVSCAIVVTRRVAGPPSPAPRRFDPVVIGTIEARGWQGYYDRKFVAGFVLLLRLTRGQMGLGPIATLRAAYAAVRAQMAFAPKLNDLNATLRWLTHFYALSPRRDGVDAVDLAGAELDYWIVHRRIVDDADKTPLIDAFARLHALLFGGDETAQRRSAEQRTLACNAVDRITGKTSTNPARDWQLVRQHLISAYQLALDAAQPMEAAANAPVAPGRWRASRRAS